MKTADSNEKVQQLCDLLQAQALQPAQAQARELLEKAKKQADEIAMVARQQADKMIEEALAQIKREREVASTSLKQAAHQAVMALRVEIEKNLLGVRLFQVSKDVLSKEELVAGLIRAYMEALRQEGTGADLSAMIERHANMHKLAEALGADFLQSLREGVLLPVLDGAGVQLKLHDKHLTVDCSEATLTEMLAQYLRKDLRERLFTQA